MRIKHSSKGLTVHVIAGTHVVLLGFDLSPEKRKACLGFAIQREDHTENERYWMSGMKTFKDTELDLEPGAPVASHKHPIQSFQWADYSAKPKHDYSYTVIPMYGAPDQLEDGDALTIQIQTEDNDVNSKQLHTIFFNRGAVASQEYARRFQNQDPDDVGDPAFRWLSRGLLEGLLAFISRATDKGFNLYGAVYEFQWSAVLEAIKAVSKGKKPGQVQVIYDAMPIEKGPKKANEAAIAKAGIKALCIPRTSGKLMHNKFFVLELKGKPIAVWTGSTNLTKNGLFGHSNCGHLIEDAGVARAYKDYWLEMRDNPDRDTEITWMAKNNPAPPDAWTEDLTTVFSPRKGSAVLEWYAEIAQQASKGLFMTLAFGMHKDFQAVYEQNDQVLRFALMEKEGNGAGLAQGRIDVARIRKRRNVVVAVAKNIVMNSFDRWLKELPGLPNAHVKYIHTKYMLVDPLGDMPVVVTGSANFSQASTDTNQENMVVIRGDKRVADIYLSEFMRLYSHYAFREAVEIWRNNHPNEAWTPNFLIPDDAWQKDYFIPNSSRFLRREYFAGR